MAIVISGVNNNDKITAIDGTIDLLSSANLTGILTAPAISSSGNITASGNVSGVNITSSNNLTSETLNVTGVATATTFVGNLTGNVNATSNLLLQIGGSEKFRVGSSGQLGIGGANYGTSGQVLTSGGSGSAATWSTVSADLVNDTSPQLGGDLASNGQDILFANNDKLKFGTGNDAAIFHNDTDFVIDAQDSGATRNIYIDAGTVNEGGIYLRSAAGDTMFKALTDSSCFLYFDDALKLRTMTDGIENRGHSYPEADNTHDLGKTSLRWRNIYTNDLNLSNKGSTNSVDNTWGDYTIQEGESDLFLINNRNGKKYQFVLKEIP